MDKRDYDLKSVQNTLRILSYFGEAGQPELSIMDLQEATGLSKSTIFRNLRALCSFGFLERSEETSKYRLGLKVVQLASYKIDTLEIRTESIPVLTLLQSRLATSISLCELQGTDVIRVVLIKNNILISENSHSIYRLPAYCSSPGKCLLSSLSGSEIDKLYEGYEFVRYTKNSITNLHDLKNELKKIREQGYSINNGEQESYTRSIAVPIYGYRGNIIASISAGMNEELFTPQKQEECLKELQNASVIISQKMGWQD